MTSRVVTLMLSLLSSSLCVAQPSLTESHHTENLNALISGRDSSTSFTVQIQDYEDITKEPVLEYSVETSEIVEANNSQLRIELDGEPLTSHTLHSQSNIVRVPLTAGFHTITFHSKLRTDDECSKAAKANLWLKVKGELRWNSTRNREMSIADVVAAMDKKSVAIEVNSTVDSDIVLAALETMNLAYNAGASEVFLQRNTRKADITVSLVVSPMLLSHAVGVLERHDTDLVMLASTPRELRSSAIAAAAQHPKCLASKCLLNQEPDDRTKDDSKEDVPSPGIYLEELGYPFGWTARGEEKHVLKFVWMRPKDWEINGWPMLDLYYRAGGIHPSALRVAIDGKPLASWDITDSGDTEKRLNIRIPKPYWKQDALTFTVTVDLTSQRQTCDDDDPSFFTLERGSSLTVPRIETKRRDIASKRVNSLTFANLEWAEWETVGRFLVGQRGSAPLEFKSGRSDLRFDLKAPIRIVKEGTQRVWKDDGGHQLPLIPLKQTMLVWAQPEGLVMKFGEGTQDITLPSVSERSTGLAFYFEGSWHALQDGQKTGEEVVAESEEEADPTMAVETNEEGLLKVIDFVWMLVLGLILAAGLFSIMKSSQRRRTA